MEIYTIPIDDQKVILYRPLLRLAFVGNQAMADLVRQLADDPATSADSMPGEIVSFLNQIGFLKPDPAPPPAPGSTYRPTTAVLLMTNRCPLRCVYCYANAGVAEPEDLAFELAQTVIDRVCQNALELDTPQFEVCYHGGGEPTYAWDIMTQATAYARSRELPAKISTVSNGIWSETQRDWILHNLDSLTISLDGSPETQNRQRPLISGRGSSEQVMKTIRALDAAGFNYGIRMTATAPWRDQFPADVRFICEETGCQTIQVEPAFNTVRGVHQQANHDEGEAFIDAFMEAFEIAAAAGRSLVFSGARPWLLTQTFCSAPYNALIVNAAGNLVTCYEIASDNHVLAEISTIGHIDHAQIFEDVAAREAMFSLLADKKQSFCQGCFCRWHCAGDCYTRSLITEGDTIDYSTIRCEVNRRITAELLLWNIMANEGVWRGQSLMVLPPRNC